MTKTTPIYKVFEIMYSDNMNKGKIQDNEAHQILDVMYILVKVMIVLFILFDLMSWLHNFSKYKKHQFNLNLQEQVTKVGKELCRSYDRYTFNTKNYMVTCVEE